MLLLLLLLFFFFFIVFRAHRHKVRHECVLQTSARAHKLYATRALGAEQSTTHFVSIIPPRIDRARIEQKATAIKPPLPISVHY